MDSFKLLVYAKYKIKDSRTEIDYWDLYNYEQKKGAVDRVTGLIGDARNLIVEAGCEDLAMEMRHQIKELISILSGGANIPKNLRIFIDAAMDAIDDQIRFEVEKQNG